MKDLHAGDRATFFLIGSAIGAVTALLVAPASGARTRRTLRRKGEDAADYINDVIDAGKELTERCEDLYKRSGKLAGDAAHDLSEKYRELYRKSKELVDEATGIIRGANTRSKSSHA
jgi:gas vesicle protein